jgi:predicted ATPase/DNA-binding SARP family transcriptional activator
MGAQSVSRFSTRKTAALLAYLALNRHRTHPREELIETFWPDVEPESGRVSLRQALASLRRQLEAPPIPPGSVFFADRSDIRLHLAAITTDVEEFEAALHAAEQSATHAAKREALLHADALYRGDLLPGFYEDWVSLARERLAEAHRNALRQLAAALQQTGDPEHALDYARRAVAADPLDEDAQCELMRLYIAAGRPADAQKQYEEMARVFRDVLDATPGPEAREILASLRIPARPVRATPSETLPVAPPPLTPPARTFTPHLPVRLTRFFGRETEIAELVSLVTGGWWLVAGGPHSTANNANIDESTNHQSPTTSHQPPVTRLITLTGPGGSGKTRLAIEVAERLTEAYRGAVWFVSLADFADPRLIPDAIRDALRLPRAAELDPLEQVIAHLHDQPALLILDNFEHLTAWGVGVVRTLLERVPTLVCLATSHRRLSIPGERVYPVRPLPIPGSEEGKSGEREKAKGESPIPNTQYPTPECPSPSDLLQFSSVQMFVDRAQAVRPDFAVTPRNAESVAALCARLEGIPLALELAAAWAGALTPFQIHDRLSERFALLTSRRADKRARHRSLWAALDWSYRLLTPDLQRLYARLFVFRGGWTLEAAERVCEEPNALLALEQLRERSLIAVIESGREMRYRMSETLREFCREQLTPEEQQEQQQQHFAYYLALAEQARAHFTGAASSAWFDRLEAEHDNLRAALAWGIQHAPESALQLAGSLWLFWYTRGYLAEGQRWLEETAAREDLPALARARAHNAAGIIARDRADYARAAELCNGALAVFRQEGGTRNIADALSYLGLIAGDQTHYEESSVYLEEALALYRQIGDEYNVARTLNAIGMTVLHQGDYERAVRVAQESLAIFRENDALQGMAFALNTLGCAYCALDNYDEAQRLHEECLELQRHLGGKRAAALSLSNLGAAVRLKGDLERAASLYSESLQLFGEVGDRWGIVLTLERVARLALIQKSYLRAARLLGAVATLKNASKGQGISPEAQEYMEERLAEARHALGEETWAKALQEGELLSSEQAILLAQSLAST